MKAQGPEAVSDPLDLTGEWDGTFAYPGGEGATPFRAKLAETRGSFGGAIIEPDIFRPASTIGARCSGHRSSRSVDFTKTYMNPPRGYENPVDYVGRLSADGCTISGVWSLLDMNGTFEMHRETGVQEMEEAETAETVPTPVVG